MPSVVHVITTGNFAGAERYVSDVARETAARGWEVAVIGGDARRMRQAVGADVQCHPGTTPLSAMLSLAKLGRQTICHAHMTVAEALAVTARPFHRAPIISTRHFSAHRGSTRAGKIIAPWIGRKLEREIAVSDFVARGLERPPAAVVRNGVPPSPLLWQPENRTVLMLQRLEREKDTSTALRAWHLSRLAEDGWSLRVVGEGSERHGLEAWTATQSIAGVEFAGWTDDAATELAHAGIFLTAAPAEPFGLAVVEAMAAGVPVVASAAGGHLETVGLTPGAAMFAAGDATAAADRLRYFLSGDARASASQAGRKVVEDFLTIERHIEELLQQYEAITTVRF